MREFKKQLYEAIGERLQPYGFSLKKKYMRFVRETSNHVIQEVCFGTASMGEKFVTYFAPQIAVFYPEIDKLFRRLDIIDSGDTGVNIGYIMPQVNYYAEWRFARDEDPTENLDAMCQAIIQYGFPLLETISTHEGLIKSLEKGGPLRQAKDSIMLPALYYLTGDLASLFKCFDSMIERKKQSYIRYCERIRELQKIPLEREIKDTDSQQYMEFINAFKRIIQEDSIHSD